MRPSNTILLLLLLISFVSDVSSKGQNSRTGLINVLIYLLINLLIYCVLISICILQRVRIPRNADRYNSTGRLSVRPSVHHVPVFCPDE